MPKVTQWVALGLKLEPSPNSSIVKVVSLCSDPTTSACPQFILVAKSVGSGATLLPAGRPQESSLNNIAVPWFAHL